MSWNLNRVLVVLAGAFALVAFAIFIGPAKGDLAQSSPVLLGTFAAVVLAFFAPAWMYLVAAILLALFPIVVLFVFGASGAITHPGSGLEGLALTFLLLSAALGLVGGIAGFVQARRGTAPPPSELGRAPQGVLAIAIFAFVAGLAVSSAWAESEVRDLATRPATSIAGTDATIRVTTDTHHFAPRNLTIPVGKLVDIHVTNHDPVVHTFSYVDGGVLHESVIPASSESDIYVKFDAARTIKFWCQPHSQGADDTEPNDMWGEMVVA